MKVLSALTFMVFYNSDGIRITKYLRVEKGDIIVDLDEEVGGWGRLYLMPDGSCMLYNVSNVREKAMAKELACS
jgi:hypothetical protein